MAGFGVHAAAGVSLSGLAATGTLLAGLASPTDMLIYLVAGSLGSLLPDLDADQSAPVQVSFTLASIALAFGVMFQFAHQFPSVAELATIWLLSYVLFRWLVFALFARITRHRGIIHSVPAGIWFGLLSSAASYHLGGLAPLSAWLLGTFVTFGFLVHLLLDELFSINLFGFKTRRSLGSAFKFWSRASPGASVAMYLACVPLLWLAPDAEPFLRLAGAEATYQRLASRVWPMDGWFRWLSANQTGPVAGATAPGVRPGG